jgi:hypothetical protein
MTVLSLTLLYLQQILTSNFEPSALTFELSALTYLTAIVYKNPHMR